MGVLLQLQQKVGFFVHIWHKWSIFLFFFAFFLVDALI